MSNPYGFRELKRPRYYTFQHTAKERFPRKVGVVLALGVVVVALGYWWANKI